MSSPHILNKGKAVVAQARLMIFRVYNYFKKEKLMHKTLLGLNLVYERTALATGLACDTVQQMAELSGEQLDHPLDSVNFLKLLDTSFPTPPLEEQSREIVMRVYRYFKAEYETNDILFPVTSVVIRASKATGLSEKMITKVVHEGKECIEKGDVFKTPGTRRKRKSMLLNKLGTEGQAIVYKFRSECLLLGNKPPKMVEIHKKLQEGIGWQGSLHSLKRIIKKLDGLDSNVRHKSAVPSGLSAVPSSVSSSALFHHQTTPTTATINSTETSFLIPTSEVKNINQIQNTDNSRIFLHHLGIHHLDNEQFSGFHIQVQQDPGVAGSILYCERTEDGSRNITIQPATTDEHNNLLQSVSMMQNVNLLVTPVHSQDGEIHDLVTL